MQQRSFSFIPHRHFACEVTSKHPGHRSSRVEAIICRPNIRYQLNYHESTQRCLPFEAYLVTNVRLLVSTYVYIQRSPLHVDSCSTPIHKRAVSTSTSTSKQSQSHTASHPIHAQIPSIRSHILTCQLTTKLQRETWFRLPTYLYSCFYIYFYFCSSQPLIGFMQSVQILSHSLRRQATRFVC